MIVDINDFNPQYIKDLNIQTRPSGNQGGRRNIYYKDIVCAFDIETTTIKEIEQSIMYIWQFQIGEEVTVIGRYWEEYLSLLNMIQSVLNEKEWLVIYVHNLSFEFQFLKGIYQFKPEEVFAIDNRKILKCEMYEHFEYRCSYLHSNMSLKQYTEKMGAKHSKLSGAEFDYSKDRYPWTELSDQELDYCIYDVLGLVEALNIEMKFDEDNLYTIPLTSTGYVRRDAKNSMRKVAHDYVKRMYPDTVLYSLLREAFRGGNTHANRWYAGQIIHDAKSYDRSSSYPDVICNCLFPVTEFKPTNFNDFDRLIELIEVRHRACIFRMKMWNVTLIDEFWGCPYLSRDKSRDIINPIYDNGRILSADYLETTLTDIDLKIVLSQYKFDNAEPFDIFNARYGALPKPLIDCTIQYYRAKTELKGDDDNALYYIKSKNKLNAIYGMMAQDPVKQNILYINDDFVEELKPIDEILGKAKRKAFLTYQWGVWTTAWARYRLEEGIRLAGDGFLYCDTDSVKYIGDVDWERYNLNRKLDSLKSGAFATDKKGIKHYMGVYEPECELYEEFSSLGAKKYCYREDGKLHITIAGVNKKLGAEELEEAGGIKAFKEGFIFRKGGGTESVYNDDPEVKHYEIEGHQLNITSNIVIKDSTYTLGVTEEYARILNDCKIYKQLYNDLKLSLNKR